MSRVLIVDRDMSRLWRVTHAVARQGLQVTPTLEGIRCIRLLRTTDHQVVVLGLSLTHWTTAVLLKWIKLRWPQMPIVALHPRPTALVRQLGLMRGVTYIAERDLDGDRLARLTHDYLLLLESGMPAAPEIARTLLASAALGTGGVILVDSPGVTGRDATGGAGADQ